MESNREDTGSLASMCTHMGRSNSPLHPNTVVYKYRDHTHKNSNPRAELQPAWDVTAAVELGGP